MSALRWEEIEGGYYMETSYGEMRILQEKVKNIFVWKLYVNASYRIESAEFNEVATYESTSMDNVRDYAKQAHKYFVGKHTEYTHKHLVTDNPEPDAFVFQFAKTVGKAVPEEDPEKPFIPEFLVRRKNNQIETVVTGKKDQVCFQNPRALATALPSLLNLPGMLLWESRLIPNILSGKTPLKYTYKWGRKQAPLTELNKLLKIHGRFSDFNELGVIDTEKFLTLFIQDLLTCYENMKEPDITRTVKLPKISKGEDDVE